MCLLPLTRRRQAANSTAASSAIRRRCRQRNNYGNDYSSHGHNFQAIEQLDSDLDGWSNLAEINAATWPGDASDHPTAGATATPPTPVPTAPAQTGRYKLIAWNDLGMHCVDDSFDAFSILPPYNNLWAQLVVQPNGGGAPQVLTQGVTVEYGFVDNSTSANKINFWDYETALFGVSLTTEHRSDRQWPDGADASRRRSLRG